MSSKFLKGTKLPKEGEIQRQICEWLEASHVMFWRNNNKPVFNRRFNNFQKMPKYTPKGLPDIIVVINSKMIGIEVKAKAKYDSWSRLSPDQMQIADRLRKAGADYFITNSLEDCQEYLTKRYVF